MNVQVINKDGKPEWAVIPWQDYQKLVDRYEMLQDIAAYDQARAAIEQGEELAPSEVMYAIVNGEHPLRVWRRYRGLTQKQLAEAAGISIAHLSQLENGRRSGTTDILTVLAEKLRLDPEDVMGQNQLHC